MFSWFAVVLGLRALGRRDHLDDRATVLALFARFTDELCSGLLVVLMPTLRARLGLTVGQVGWCFQAMASVGAVVEPTSGVAIDLIRRRPLLVGGAAAWAAALLLAAGAESFGWLVAAFALVGLAYGPLANTADVVLVEAHPAAVERIASRSTALDTVGALLTPAAIAVASAVGVDARLLLVGAGLGALGYAWLLVGTILPPPTTRAEGVRTGVEVAAGLRAVLADRSARTWIAALLLVELVDPLEVFEPVWLGDVVGVSQTLVAVHVATGTVASLLALLAVDRWLADHDGRALLAAASVASLVAFPAWLLVPGFVAKLVLVVLRDAATAPLWPIVHARALAAVPGRAGAVTALTALSGLLPIHAAFGWVAEQVGLTRSMLWLHLAATAGLIRLVRRDRRATPPSDEASGV